MSVYTWKYSAKI